MKSPLIYQVSEYDCGPTSLLNSLIYLYNRDEIPAEIIKIISQYTLDSYDENLKSGQGGTSKESMELVCKCINQYSKLNDININLNMLKNNEINLKTFKSIIKNNGVILIKVWLEGGHYVIITNIKNNKIYIFDPYYLDTTYFKNDDMINITYNNPFLYNRIIESQRIFDILNKNFSMGDKNKRFAIAIMTTSKTGGLRKP